VTVELIDRYLSTEETLDAFDRATLVCLPYLESSQSGVAAMAVGLSTPAVATAVGGLPDLLRPGREALVVPPGDAAALAAAIDRVLDDGELRARMMASSSARAAGDLSWSSIAAATSAVYRLAIG
jgi:glycosyltransferase involved in cell wall biosynthesis